jgi:uncharacterized protein DUF4082/Big-like domain-containing protein/molybdenum-dependent oxidoreductase-like protein
MTKIFHRFTKRYANVLVVLTGLVVVSSILLHSGCGMVKIPNIPVRPTPTPAPTPTPNPLRPTSIIVTPGQGFTRVFGISAFISGIASPAGGGSVARVEVSVDGGATWNIATGTSRWEYLWTPSSPGQVTIKTRAIDNSGNQQDPPAEIAGTVGTSACPITTPDPSRPTSRITSPLSGANLNFGTVSILGTSSAGGGGSVARVEVSVDGGATWNIATGTSNWEILRTLSLPGQVTIKSRAIDVSGNQQDPPAEITVVVGAPIQTVISVSPEPDATCVPVSVMPAATFSSALTQRTVNFATISLTDAANNPVPITVTTVSRERVATLVPQRLLQPGQKYTVTLKGGPAQPHIEGDSGFLPSDYTWSFTTAPVPPPINAYKIWPSNPTPKNPTDISAAPTELGLKFRSKTDGLITGVRFYKGDATNGGAHLGHLWTLSGTLLGSVTFTNETDSGWQEALFLAPIPITANTTFVVSYFAQQGHYASDNGYFDKPDGVDSGPLHALSNKDAGGNGVFLVGPQGGFPTDSFQSSNYWVDVIFIDSHEPPQVYLVNPAPGASNVPVDFAPTVVFSKPMDDAHLDTSTVLLSDTLNNPVPVDISYNPSDFTVTLIPQVPLKRSQAYTVTLKGGAAEPHITDSTGTPLASDFTWSFTTEPLYPILVITTKENKFTQYYPEILQAEGITSFNVLDITQVTATVLDQYQLVILGEMPLTSEQAQIFSARVRITGGRLIAMRPDKKLASLFGLTDTASILSDAYLQVDASREPGAGIVNQTIQYHGPADLYTFNPDTQGMRTLIATLYSSPAQTTSNPAVTHRRIQEITGESPIGQAVAFTFDLARSIVYSRQGNPAWVGQDRDGTLPIRPNDLFFGGNSDPNFVNLDKVEIPQADELQRLLANIILYMGSDFFTATPLPRFWYLPGMKKAAILMAGDDHGTPNSTQTTFDMLINESPQPCSVADWSCYRATGWLYTSSGLTNAQALDYQNQGFDLGAHVTTDCGNWTPQTLEDFFTLDLASFAAKYTSLPAQTTNRTHCTPWSDWATHPKVEFKHGVRLDMNYYYYPGSWIQNRPGFMTGSGFPMRYVDLDGSIIDVYQAATHLVNENGVTYPDGINGMLDKALGPEGYYGVFGARYDYTDTFAAQLLDSARARNVSLISAQQLLTWIEGRNSSTFSNPSVFFTGAVSGSEVQIVFSISAGADNLYAMIPDKRTSFINEPNLQINSITINGSPVPFTVEMIKGRSYAVFPATTGNVVATYGRP